MSLLMPDTGLLFWMLLCFLVVFGILAKFGFPVITHMVESRKQYIDQSLEVARKANEQLANLKAEGEAILRDAQAEKARILAQAKADSQQLMAQAQLQAKEEGNRLLQEVRQQINAEKEDAIRDIRRQVVTLSVDVAQMVLRSQLDTNPKQTALIDKLLDEVNQPK